MTKKYTPEEERELNFLVIADLGFGLMQGDLQRIAECTQILQRLSPDQQLDLHNMLHDRIIAIDPSLCQCEKIHRQSKANDN